MKLSDKVVVITGASSGIGRASALAFAADGARLVLAARGESALTEVSRLCRARGADTLVVAGDIGDPGDVERLTRSALERFHRIDVWVQSAAGVIAGPFGSESVEEIRRLLDTNVLGNVLVARQALATFEAQSSGTLILVSSLLGLAPNPQVPLYSMTKYATRGLALNLRQATARHPHVHVCLVLPGPVDTPLFERAANRTGRRLRAIPPAYSPERLAAAVLSCARRPRRQLTVGVASHAMLVAHRLAPRPTEWAVAKWSASLITTSEPAGPAPRSLFRPPAHGAVRGGHRRGGLRRWLGDHIGRARLTSRSVGAPGPHPAEV